MSETLTQAEPVARTSAGLVRGEAIDGIARFLSVPYAAAPVGERRFRAPQPHPPWSGERAALTPGPCAPQPAPPATRLPGLDLSPLMDPGLGEGDAFLACNIWTPDHAAAGLPVMVFIHGGAFLMGSKDAPLYDGAAFARAGVVLVSINYRMGLEGFVHIPGADTNLGLRDQIAALAWVRENVRAFGGDPGNVTVFGESAGAMTISDLIASPLAKGLFRRAIVQSGHGAMVRSIGVAERLTRALATKLGVTADIQGFAGKTIEEGVAATQAISLPTVKVNLREAGGGGDPTFGLSKFLPVFGDEVLPKRPLDALAEGAGAEVDLLIGSNREEMNFYFVATGAREKLNLPLAWFLLSRVHPRAWSVLRAYGLGKPGRKAGHVFVQAMHDLVFRWPARRFAETHKGRTHVYEFEWRSPLFAGELGACHGMELGFVFNTLTVVTGPEGMAGPSPPQALADRIQKLWVDFARDGALPWGPYSRENRQVFQLQAGVSVVEPPAPAARYLP